MATKICNNFGFKISYKYVSTEENPSDFLTRGLSVQKFKDHLNKWIHGPQWLTDAAAAWPSSPLHCLNDENKAVVQQFTAADPAAPCLMSTESETRDHLIKVEQYSSYNPNITRFYKLLVMFLNF